MKLKSKFPEIYHQFIPDFLDHEVPKERFADCGNCHLCASDKLSVSMTKCCTYHAILPNYIIGAILSEDDSMTYGKEKIFEKIANKHGVSPYGISGTKDMLELETRRKVKKLNMLVMPVEEREKFACPYLEDQKCSIWKYRSELCITYFCNPVSGKFGNQFWNAVLKFIRYMELQLSNFALREINYPRYLLKFEPIEHDTFSFYDQKGNFKEAQYDKLWATFKEEELYKRCYDIISKLDKLDIDRILGLQGEIMQEKCLELLTFAKDNILPDGILFSDQNIVKPLRPGVYEISNPSGVKVQVNQRTLMALKMFDGSKNPQDVQRESNMVLSVNTSLVQSYLNKQILVTS